MTVEEARKAHMREYGSMLHCPKHGNLCSFMYGSWETGCKRQPCILDDPEDQKLQERIRERRQKQIEVERQHRKEEKDAAPIRDQRNRIKSYIENKLDEIHRIEEASRRAYSQNRPREGDTLFNRARIMRGELRRFEEEKLKESR